MPMKPLSFKGDKKTIKKRKRDDNNNTYTTPSTTQHTSQGNTDTNTNNEEEESWTSPTQPTDLTGPTMLVLPTKPPTCLASDPNGRIYASPIENMIEGDPRTAEPHDVRQVWVATKVPGSNMTSITSRPNLAGDAATGETESVEIGFKGAHGGWLSCDTMGVLGAVREARGTEEGFVLEKISPSSIQDSGATINHSRQQGTWLLRTAASKKTSDDNNKSGHRYLCAIVDGGGVKKSPEEDVTDDTESHHHHHQHSIKKVSISLRGDGETTDDSSRLVLRMQARFLPKSVTNAAGGHQRTKEKVSRYEMEKAVGRRLEDHEVKALKRAKRHGNYHEEVLDLRTKASHDKFA